MGEKECSRCELKLWQSGLRLLQYSYTARRADSGPVTGQTE